MQGQESRYAKWLFTVEELRAIDERRIKNITKVIRVSNNEIAVPTLQEEAIEVNHYINQILSIFKKRKKQIY